MAKLSVTGRRDFILDISTVLAISTAALTLYYHPYIVLRPLNNGGDLNVPYLSSNIAIILSSYEPWYTLLVNYLHALFPATYGYLLNSLGVYLIALAPVAMYVLLRELNLGRFSSVASSVIYIVNPISFPALFSYPNLDWAELYIFLPLISLFLVRYWKKGETRDWILFCVLTTIYIQIQYGTPYLYNLREIFPAIGLLFLVIAFRRIASTRNLKVLRDLSVFLIFLIINLVPVFITGPFQAGLQSNNTQFYVFHFGNVIYTYQSQNLFYAISGLVVVPNYTNSLLEGNGQMFFLVTLVWVLIAVVSVIASFLINREFRVVFFTFSISSLLIWTFISLVQAHKILWIFKLSSIFFLWEYPSYLEMILAFLYIPLIANLIDSIGRVKKHSFEPKRAGILRQFLRLRKSTEFRKVTATIFAVSLIIIIVVPAAHYSISSQNELPANMTLPAYFEDFTAYFHNKEGDYKILLVPFSQATADMFGSSVPQSCILDLPYAYQNNPNAFANITLFNEIYSSIFTGNFGNLSYYFNMTFVKYILIFNQAVSAHLTENLTALSYVSVVDRNENFTLLKYNDFNGALILNESYVYSHTINRESSTLIDFVGNGTAKILIPTSDSWQTYGKISVINKTIEYNGFLFTVKVYGNGIFLNRAVFESKTVILYNLVVAVLVLMTLVLCLTYKRKSKLNQ